MLLVEFAVTHPCGPDKLRSGLRILEIDIQEDNDVDQLRQGLIVESCSSSSVRLHNARKQASDGRLKVSCRGRCARRVDVFVVYESGRSVIIQVAPRKALEGDPRAMHWEVLPAPYSEERGLLFRRKVREAYFQGAPVRNCYLCRYHGLGDYEGPIFCKTFKESVPSNAAADCPRYRLLSSIEACERVDEANEAYQKKRWAKGFW